MLNSNLVGKCNVEDKKTGKMETKDAVWVNVAPLERENYEDSLTAKSASKQFVTDKATTATLQNFSKRMQNFAAGSEFDQKFHSSILGRYVRYMPYMHKTQHPYIHARAYKDIHKPKLPNI